MAKIIIDISAIYWRAWHASGESDVSSARRRTVATVDAIVAHERPNSLADIIVAIDSPPYVRREWYADYKAQREERSAASIEELRAAIESCEQAGYSIASASGWEADDVIATLCAADPEARVYGADKDLLQSCDLIDPSDMGRVMTAENRLGIKRSQVPDYLALVGDSSDNIPGVKGIGPKTACAMLDKFGSLGGIMRAVDETPESFKPSTHSALDAARNFLPLALKLTTLHKGAPVQIKEGKKMEVQETIEPASVVDDAPKQSAEIVPMKSAQTPPAIAPRSFRTELEPGTMDQAWRVSVALHQSRLYSQFANEQAIFATIMRGRALGIDATTALDSIHVIKGKPTMSASLMAGLVRNSGKCLYLDCVETTAERCTWVTRREGSQHEQTITFTIEEARSLGLVTRDQWIKQPAVMLRWRALAALCRMVYSDIIAGLYAREEMED